MSNYPESAGKIVDDYLQRVKAKLRGVPSNEEAEFLREIESHIYEAYQQTAGENHVERILSVLRNFGEPSEVVSDRLPGSMVRSGGKRNLPLYILAGILIAFFGIPLGFSGVGALLGVLGSIFGLLLAYYALAGSALAVGGLLMVLGLARLIDPISWDKLQAAGILQLDGPNFFTQLPPSIQGVSFVLLASLFIALGVALLWFGKYIVRGLRFLAVLAFDWIRDFARNMRAKSAASKLKTMPMRETVITAK